MDILEGFPTTGHILWGIFIFFFVRTVYRLYFHPLRKFPGPKLAAISHSYEFVYDVMMGGKYIFEIERMHKVYGPIIRINPRQLHISDPQFYNAVYAGGTHQRDKDPAAVAIFSSPTSMIATVSHAHHRRRRGIVSDFFSKRSITQFESVIQEKIDKLARRFEEAYETQRVLRLDAAFSALTADVITQYCYGESGGYLDNTSFDNDVKKGPNALLILMHVSYFFPQLHTLLGLLPIWVVRKLSRSIGDLADFQRHMRNRAIATLQREDIGIHRNTIFDALANLNVPPEERTVNRIADEAAIMFTAGIETTANTLISGMYHLLKNRSILLRLREELRNVMPTLTSSCTWAQLEQLPYMNGVINESLRLSLGAAIRLPRVSPAESLTYHDYEIPPGTPVSIATCFLHMNPEIFPDPESFSPQRWIQAAERGDNLNRYLVPFTKGSRQCVGMNLALAEIFLTFSYLARRFDMELYETTDDDVRFARDLGVPGGENGRWNARVVVKELIDV